LKSPLARICRRRAWLGLAALIPGAALAIVGNLVLSHVKLDDTAVGGALIAGDQFGLDVTSVGDADGDGIGDIAVGARLNDSGSTDAGSFWLVFLDASGHAKGAPIQFADTVNDPNSKLTLESSAFFGDGLAGLPDFDGDATAEVKIAVGASAADPGATPADSGAVYLVDIDKSSLTISNVVTIASGSQNFPTLDAGDRFGLRVRNLGDWDGDGAPELAVGAHLDDDGAANNGAVYIIYLKPDGTGVKTYAKLSDTQGGFDGVLSAGANLGPSAAIGDLDGDEQPDLAIGAFSDGNVGAFFVAFMDPGCAISTTTVPHPGCVAKPGAVKIGQGQGGFSGTLQAGGSFGTTLAWLGSDAGPGRIAVGAQNADSSTGELWIVSLGADGRAAGQQRIASGVNWSQTLPSGTNFGVAATAVGDRNGDLITDLLVGAWLDDVGGTNTGAAYLLMLNACATIVTAPIVFDSPNNSGVNPCAPTHLFTTGTNTLHLYLETGTEVSSIPGDVCHADTADGDELCAWDARIAVDPPMYISGFTPNPSLGSAVRTNGPPYPLNELRVNWLGSGTHTNPGAGPIKIGDLTVSGGNASVRVASGSAAVGAGVQLFTIPEATLALPEPGTGIGVLAGAIALAALARLRPIRARRAALLSVVTCSAFVLSTLPVAAATSVKGQMRIVDFAPGAAGFNRWARSPISLGDLGSTSLQGDGSSDLVIGEVLYQTGILQGVINPAFLDEDTNVLGFQRIYDGTSEMFGHAIANLGDINGNGKLDLLVGAPDPGVVGVPGKAQMLELGADGNEIAGSRTTILSGGDYLGISVAALGDLDGDGLTEVAVGDTSPQGVNLLSIHPITRAVVSNFRIDSELPIGGTQFGFAVTGIGDLDGDGVRDLAIGAPADSDVSGSCPGKTYNLPGAVWIVFLQVNGPSLFSVKSYQKISETQGNLGLCLGGYPSDLSNGYWGFGGALASHGDVLDVAGTVLYVSGSYGNSSATNTGFYALALRPNGTVRKAYQISHASGVGFVNARLTTNRFGASLGALPDMNGDETLDVAVGDIYWQTPGAESVYVLYMQDTDHDGLDDNLDNCPTDHNPEQEDAEGDGVGDLCDNCPALANADQADADADDEGDLCEPVEVQLVTTGSSPSWTLSLQCGAFHVKQLNGAIVLPAGAGADSAHCPGPPYPKGCLALNGTSIGGGSGTSGPGLTSPSGVRSDAIYFSALGNGAGGRLCTALDPPTYLGTLTTGLIGGTQLAASSLTAEGVGVPGFGLPLAQSTSGIVPQTSVRLVNGLPLPILDLQLGPAVFTGSGTRWDVIARNASAEFHRVTFGLIAPAGTTTSQMRWVGCSTPPSGNGVRSCTGGIGFGATTSAANSFTQGPLASPPGTELAHTLYVSLVGNRPSQSSQLTFNPVNGPAQVTLGTIELDAAPDLEPAITVDGVESVIASPLEKADSGVPSPTQLRLIGAFDPAEDLDNDEVQDLSDDCPFTADPAQENRGSFLDAADDSDALGDACQCGEATDDGAVFGADVDQIRDYLTGLIINPGIAAKVEARCSVAGTTDCNIRDLVLLQNALGAGDPSVPTRCDAALSPAN
jgi:FG-GAP repeat